VFKFASIIESKSKRIYTKDNNKMVTEAQRFTNQTVKLLTPAAKLRICIAAGVSESTLNRWIRSGSAKLVHPVVMKAVAKETGLAKKEILIG